MIQRLPPKSLYRLVNRTQLDVVERLETQYPGVPWHLIYEKVNEARASAAKRLPDLAAYGATLEELARALILASSTQRPVPPTQAAAVHV